MTVDSLLNKLRNRAALTNEKQDITLALTILDHAAWHVDAGKLNADFDRAELESAVSRERFDANYHVLTVQLQVDSNQPISDEFLKDIIEATWKFQSVLNLIGYSRAGVFVDGELAPMWDVRND